MAPAKPIPLGPVPALFPLSLSASAVCLLGTLMTDIVYWRTAVMMWTNFSAWLVSAGVVFGFLAVVLWIVDTFRGPLVRAELPPWRYGLGYCVALVLATVNMLVHTRDAWASVVPWGLVLSIATAVILVVTGWMARAVRFRTRTGVVL